MQHYSNCFICLIHSIGPTRPLSMHILFFIFTYMRKLMPEWWEKMPNRTVSKGQNQEWSQMTPELMLLITVLQGISISFRKTPSQELTESQEFNNCLGANEWMDTRRRKWVNYLTGSNPAKSLLPRRVLCVHIAKHLTWILTTRWSDSGTCKNKTEPLRVLTPLPPSLRVYSWKWLIFPLWFQRNPE